MPMKRMIMNSSMINMAYLSGMLSNLTVSGEGPATGQTFRKLNASTYLDSIAFIKDQGLFENSYWNRFSEKGGIYLVEMCIRDSH